VQTFDATRKGLSLGEAGGFALLERVEAARPRPSLRGYGESSDAHHMSAPHPEGLGARLAMGDALARAGVQPADIGYLNCTAPRRPPTTRSKRRPSPRCSPKRCTRVRPRAGPGTRSARPASSNRCARCSRWNTACCRHPQQRAVRCRVRRADPFRQPERAIRYAMNNSFGFGGNNCSLVFAADAPMNTLSATIEGIGFWSNGLPTGPPRARSCATVRCQKARRASFAAAARTQRAPTRAGHRGGSRWQWRSPPAPNPARSRDSPVGVRLHARRPRITDYMCATLAADPRSISPTRFHNSVHNAARLLDDRRRLHRSDDRRSARTTRPSPKA
jgi:hypothetical protein